MTQSTNFARDRRLWSLGLLLLIVALPGCGGNPVVSGTVTYKKVPLNTGEVSFIGSDGKSRSGLIGSDGRYEIVDPPKGEVTIVVTASRAEPSKAGGSPLGGADFAKNARAVPVQSLVPTRYGDPKSSDLRYVVVSGKQRKDIDLVD
jgi:hypothetical protein